MGGGRWTIDTTIGTTPLPDEKHDAAARGDDVLAHGASRTLLKLRPAATAGKREAQNHDQFSRLNVDGYKAKP